MTTFTIKHEDLFKLMKMMKPFVKNVPKIKDSGIILEVNVTPDGIQLLIPNCTMNAKCQTNGIGRFSLPYLYFYEIIKSYKTEIITIELGDGKVLVGQTSIRAITQL